jgi:glycosyltransferase involved in cell wall biosynthesis
MKIGHLIISNQYAGAENVVYNSAKYMVRAGAEIAVFANHEISMFYAFMENVKLWNLGKFNDSSRIAKRISYFYIGSRLRKILKQEKFDIIHVHLEPGARIYHLFCRGLDIPLFLTLHGGEIRNYRQNIENPRKNKALDLIFAECDEIISISHWQIDDLKKELRSKIRVIPNGVDTDFFRPLDLPREKNTILYVGRYLEWKGIKNLINVASLLPEYKFWFAGSGPHDSKINLNNTTNLGKIDQKDLLKKYNQATICVFPSFYEPFSCVGLEAMSCGKAIIATKKGFSEYIDTPKDGIIIEPNDEPQLKKAIKKLIEDPAYRKKIEDNARKKALSFDWSKIVNQHLSLYKKYIKP